MIHRARSAIETHGLIGAIARVLKSPSPVVHTLLGRQESRIVQSALCQMVADVTGGPLPQIGRFLEELRQDTSFWLGFQRT